MDFMNRNDQGQSATSAPNAAGVSGVARAGVGRKKTEDDSKLKRIAGVALMFALTILVVAVIAILAFGSNSGQSKYVASGQYQAVFLTNGQVYFGKLDNISGDYFKLQDIYYLTQNTTTSTSGQTTTDGNYTLVKLGCQQIHDPTDQMIIERSQVSFWENLNDNGKVVTSINQFKKQNPNGPDCSQVSSQTQASSNSSSNQGGSSAATGTNSATNGTGTSTGSTSKNP